MISARLSLLGLGLALGASLTAGELPPAGATSCLGCHPMTARRNGPVPGLAGQPADQITARMQAWRDGAEPGSVMARIAKGFDEGKTAAIALYFSHQAAR
jgi:cytochrome c553